MLERWNFTVCSVTQSFLAIWPLESPLATTLRISSSLGVGIAASAVERRGRLRRIREWSRDLFDVRGVRQCCADGCCDSRASAVLNV